jgi:hypothetical protein
VTTAYRWTPAQEIAWLIVNKDKIGGKAAKMLTALRKHQSSYIKLVEIKDQKDPQAAYDALPKGAPYTHQGKVLRKGGNIVRVQHPDGRTGTIPAHQLSDALAQGYQTAAEHRQYQGNTYRLRPGTDRSKASNWDIVPVPVKSRWEALKLMPGTHFKTPDGRVLVR